MGRFQDLDLQKILKDSEDLVRAVEQQTNHRLFAEVDPGPEVTAMQRQGAQLLAAEIDHSRDGACDIVVSTDGMQVTADFYPPAGSGKPLSLDQFLAQLAAAKVTHGLLLPVIETSVCDCALNRRVIEGAIVARGTPALDYQPEQWVVEPTLVARKKQVDETAIFLDFKTQSPFVLVKKGDLLCHRIAERPGHSGTTALGNVLEFSKIPAPALIPGENVVSSPEGYRAACDGSFRQQEFRFWVDPILVLDSGVDY